MPEVVDPEPEEVVPEPAELDGGGVVPEPVGVLEPLPAAFTGAAGRGACRRRFFTAAAA